jgi:hypothetical protein
MDGKLRVLRGSIWIKHKQNLRDEKDKKQKTII